MNTLWFTQPDQDGNYHFVKKLKNGKSEQTILRGVSLMGFEYLPRDKTDTTNLLLSFFDPDDSSTHTLKNFTTIVKNMVDTLCDEWGANLIRVPICLSAYSEAIKVSFMGDQKSYSYPYLIKIAISAILNRERVVVIDGHIWATDSTTSKMAYPQSCSFNFDQNRPTNTQNYGIQLYALQDVMDVSTGKPVPNVISAWKTIVSDTMKSFQKTENIWFEFINEPFYRPFSSEERIFSSNRVKFRNWKTFFHTLIQKTREIAPNNILIINGLDRGYDFLDAIEELEALPYRNLRTLFGNDNHNIAYGVHPFQIASCCGLISSPGDDVNVIDTIRKMYIPYRDNETATLLESDQPYTMDQSIFDPYERAYCNFPGKISNRNLYQDNMKGKAFSIPSSSGNYYFDLPAATQNTDLAVMKCDHSFNKSQSKKLPPCQFEDRLIDARTGTQFVGTYVGDCSTEIVNALSSKKFNVPASGWSKYFLGMQKYGPLIATAFGTFDCSLPYITAFLEYAEMNSMSWIAFGIQPYLPYLMYKNNLNPCNLSCLSIPALSPANGTGYVKSVLATQKRIGNYMECLDRKNCSLVLTPIGNKGGYGDTIQKYMKQNIKKEESVIPPRPGPKPSPSKPEPKPSPPEPEPEPSPPKPEPESSPPEPEPEPSPPKPEPGPKSSTTLAPKPSLSTTSIIPEIITTSSLTPSGRRSAATFGYIFVFAVIPIIFILFLLGRYMYRHRQTIMAFFHRQPQVLGTPPSSSTLTVENISSADGLS